MESLFVEFWIALFLNQHSINQTNYLHMGLYYKFRQEELPVVGEILLQLFLRDREKFVNFSPEFNDEFVKSLQTDITRVADLTQSKTQTAEIKKITSDLYASLDAIQHKLELIAAYTQRANKLMLVKASDFGVKEARKMIRLRNVEGYCAKVKVIQQNIAKNLDALKGKGYKESLGTELEQMTQKVYDLNLSQEQKISERKQLVVNNNVELLLFWKKLSDIAKTGKMILKEDESKAEEYMFSHLIYKVRKVNAKIESKKKRIEVAVANEIPAPKQAPVKKEEAMLQSEESESFI
ncbi:hypothetical protein BZG02_14360 [Labilibaculum filiforme]|uniref:Uncharacterized protein n=2 Tax=Labilibaculum filiforme TaxID=1940526 RepID=A0A2N3HUU8_9BACT|nr:hypothetical protein BZG02_14360 [Labilibaculum filiforme]